MVVLGTENEPGWPIFSFYTNVNDMIYFPGKSKSFLGVELRSGYYHILGTVTMAKLIK